MQGDAQAQLTALRDEGNKLFGKKEYTKALECYDKALKSIQAGHPDKPLLHSNKAACHMMGKRYVIPVNYNVQCKILPMQCIVRDMQSLHACS